MKESMTSLEKQKSLRGDVRLRSSEELDRFIAITADYYCNKLGISDKRKPDIVTSAIILPNKENSDLNDDIHGRYFSQGNIIFLKIDDIPDLIRLEYVIVHELFHCKNIKWKHGPQFEKRIEEVLI
jgi:hypothetical protein